MKGTFGALAAVAVAALLGAGCSGGGGPASGAGAAIAPVASGGGTTAPVQSSLSFRTLDQGDETSVRATPPAATTKRTAASAADLKALWADHTSGRASAPALPAVDFTQERVAALFLGERPSGGHAIEVVAVAEVVSGSKTTVEVHYVTRRPAGPATAQFTHPFHVVAFNRVQGAIAFKDVTPTPPVVALADVHGELAAQKTLAGATTLGFVEDGTTAPREVVDQRPLVAAGALAWTSLVLTGDAQANVAGVTTATESVRVVSFKLDDVQATGRVGPGPQGIVSFKANDGKSYVPIGPLAQAVLAAPQDRPLRVTGRIDPTYSGGVLSPPGLIVTSWRETVQVGLKTVGGLLGLDEGFAVDDLPATGAFRFRRSIVVFADVRAGNGRLAPGERASLEALVQAAHLRTQPAIFKPPFPILDAPTTYVVLADKQGDVKITIEAGAKLPPEVDALLKALRASAAKQTTFRTLAIGSQSQVTQPGTAIARDAASFAALWATHAGAASTPPTVDFTKGFVVAVFMGQKPSSGFAIEVTRLDRAGDDVVLKVEQRSPTGPALAVITDPFHFVVVEPQGASGNVVFR